MSLSRSQRLFLESRHRKSSIVPKVDMRQVAYQAPKIYGEFPRETIWQELWREVKSVFSFGWAQPHGAFA